MRGAWLVWVVLAIAGCGEDGIFIEVQAPPGMKLDRVELVMGDRDCVVGGAKCAQLEPPAIDGARLHLGRAGDVFFRANETDDYSAAVEADGSAYFHLPPGTGTIQILALGTATSGNGDTVAGAAVMIPVDRARSPIRYVTPLLPAAVLTPTSPRAPPGAGVQVWRSPGGLACVGVNDFSTQRGTVLVVPESDPDCDGVIDNHECAPLTYLNTEDPSPFQATCVSEFPTVGGTAEPACMLGGLACNEVTGASSPCSSTNFCIPEALCAKCANMFDDNCLKEAFIDEAATHIACVFPVQPDPADANAFEACTAGPRASNVDFDASLGAPCLGLPQIGVAQLDPFAATVDLPPTATR